MTVSIDIRCDHCRGNSLSIPLEGGDEAIVDCEDCGQAVGTLADIKTQVTLQVLGRKKIDKPMFLHWN